MENKPCYIISITRFADYMNSKDSFQLSYKKPLPKVFIHKFAEYRVKDVKENGALWMY